jgi:hypothetical protein
LADWLVQIITVLIPTLGVGTVAAIVVKHTLDARAAERERRRSQVAEWRAMLARTNALMSVDGAPSGLVRTQPEYMALHPHLTDEAHGWLNREGRITWDGTGLHPPLAVLASEVDRIEKGWNLVD